MRRILFIDRDGTIIDEPQDTFQVDSFRKLKFLPKVFQSLNDIRKSTDFDWVMVTNQDGLGTPAFPEKDFWPVHQFILETLRQEGIIFREVLIDRSFSWQNLETRKPGTGLVRNYFSESFDLKNSFVIGDRISDIEFAKNMGCKAIWLNVSSMLPAELEEFVALRTKNWTEIAEFLKNAERIGMFKRTTKETSIQIRVNLDGNGEGVIDTGIPFFDHMLQQLTRHGSIDLDILASGDLQIDYHHTIEDVGIALGQAVRNAVAAKAGMNRYGFALPMDEASASVLIDFSGRSYFKWKMRCREKSAGGINLNMFQHFFRSFAENAAINLHIKAKGDDGHHCVEAVFKAFAHALKMAIKRQDNLFDLPSTKGIL